jgi:crotonobetainyl-CoA:carnitine CoA-transferase CaiB-like acyl-CoA transferase
VADCLAQLDAIDVPCAKVQRIDEVLADPQVLARGMLVEQDHPVLGKVQLPGLPYRFSGCDTTQTVPAPLLGQHNRRIAAALGYAEDDIETLFRDGVLYAEEAVAGLAAGEAA